MAIDWERIIDEMTAEVSRMGFEWVDFSRSSSLRSPWLRLFVDRREGPFTIDDATYLTRVLVNWLAARLPETQDFRLEVSSPGLDRPFHYPWQFQKQLGQNVIVRLHDVGGSTRELEGKIATVGDESIVLDVRGDMQPLEWPQVIDARIHILLPEKPGKSKGKRK